ncbi:hypothetical protein D3C81_1002790 [compost metagenome]
MHTTLWTYYSVASGLLVHHENQVPHYTKGYTVLAPSYTIARVHRSGYYNYLDHRRSVHKDSVQYRF